MLRGGCHCGALAVAFGSGRAAADLPPRACDCARAAGLAPAQPASPQVLPADARRARWAQAWTPAALERP